MSAIRLVFVDTGVLYARVDRADRHHSPAVARCLALARESTQLTTTSLVVAETFSLLQRRLGHSIAHRWLLALSRSSIDVIWPPPDVLFDACDVLNRFRDQDFSFTDAVSFSVMMRESIGTYLSFDSHFPVFGRQRGWSAA